MTKIQRLDFARSSIAEHEQDAYQRSDLIDILIDIARDTIAHLFQSDRDWASSQVELWWQSEIPLLHRLALFAATCNTQASADDLVAMLIERRLLFSFETKKETFDLLAFVYPRASTECRKVLVGAIEGTNGNRRKIKNDRLVSAYERYNVLVWLEMKTPDCEFVLNALSRITTANPDFGPREHPDLDIWHGQAEFVDPSEGVNFADILSGPPSLYLEQLLRAPVSGFGKDRRDMCSNLTQLAEINRDWGLSFLTCAAESVGLDSALWSTILVEYSSLLKTREDWLQFTPILELLLRNKESLHGVVWLVNHTMWPCHHNVPEDTIVLCMKFVNLAWCERKKAVERERQFFRDWYTTAINQLGGWIGDSWVRYCSHLRQKEDHTWAQIPDEIRARLVEAVSNEDETAINARIALTPWIAYFFVWDPEFTRQHLLPLFDWSRNAEVSQQTWSVLLAYSRGSAKTMEIELLPFYRSFAQQISSVAVETGEHLEQFNREAQDRFGRHIARIAMDVIELPKRVAFLEEFIVLLTPPAREGLAQSISFRLKEMTSEECEVTWQDWLREYLDLRLLGRPASLTTNEASAFKEAGFSLTRSFPEFVDRFVQMPLVSVFVYSVLEELKRSNVWNDYPIATCRFLTHLLPSNDGSFIPRDINALSKSLKLSVGHSPEFKEFEDELYRQGWRP
ncbi:MAG: hypothetical protein WKF77_26365 [Planctomycetaceae bacterium]